MLLRLLPPCSVPVPVWMSGRCFSISRCAVLRDSSSWPADGAEKRLSISSVPCPPRPNPLRPAFMPNPIPSCPRLRLSQAVGHHKLSRGHLGKHFFFHPVLAEKIYGPPKQSVHAVSQHPEKGIPPRIFFQQGEPVNKRKSLPTIFFGYRHPEEAPFF